MRPDDAQLPYWVLDETHRPVPADIDTVAAWAADPVRRRVAWTQFDGQGVFVSTTFLCFDHNFTGYGPPLLFETMIFWDGHELDEAQERYATWDEALAGHDAACTLVMRALRALGVEPSALLDGVTDGTGR